MFLDPEVFIGTMIERSVHHAINVSVYTILTIGGLHREDFNECL